MIYCLGIHLDAKPSPMRRFLKSLGPAILSLTKELNSEFREQVFVHCSHLIAPDLDNLASINQ